MKRYIALILLFVLVLAAPFLLRTALVPSTRAGDAAGGNLERLVVVTPHTSDIRNEYARAFRAWHREHYGVEVELDFRVPGGSNDVKRYLESTYQPYRDSKNQLPSTMNVDAAVAWGGGDFFFDQELKPLGILQPLTMNPNLLVEFHRAFPQPTLAGVKLHDATANRDGTPTPQWIGVCLSSFGICYNPDVYRSLNLPAPDPTHGWRDLTDPRLSGFVALADPAHSGSASVAYQMVIQRRMADAEADVFARDPKLKALPKKDLADNAEYQQAIAAGWKQGMAELLRIAANARYFTDSSTIPPMDVSRGEAAAGIAIDFYAKVTEESAGSDRIRFFAPIGATAITPDPVAVLYGVAGRKLELAQHFVEFLLTQEGQRLWNLKPGTPGGPLERSLRRMPIRADVYADRANWADSANPFQEAAGFNQRGAWMALFTDTRPIWVAAWIDSRDALRDAYGKILKVRDPSRQAALLDRLSDLPIEMADVDAIRKQRKSIDNSHGELDEWRARQAIDWAERFRAHYRAVGREAHDVP